VYFGLRSGLPTNCQYKFRVFWAQIWSYKQLAVYGPWALALGTVLQPIGSTGSVYFGLGTGLTTNWQYKVSVPWA